VAAWGGKTLHFNQPIDVKLDSLGKLYVVDSATDLIVKLSRDGHPLAEFGGLATK
jgi:hypothetical protein